MTQRSEKQKRADWTSQRRAIMRELREADTKRYQARLTALNRLTDLKKLQRDGDFITEIWADESNIHRGAMSRLCCLSIELDWRSGRRLSVFRATGQPPCLTSAHLDHDFLYDLFWALEKEYIPAVFDFDWENGEPGLMLVCRRNDAARVMDIAKTLIGKGASQ